MKKNQKNELAPILQELNSIFGESSYSEYHPSIFNSLGRAKIVSKYNIDANILNEVKEELKGINDCVAKSALINLLLYSYEFYNRRFSVKTLYCKLKFLFSNQPLPSSHKECRIWIRNIAQKFFNRQNVSVVNYGGIPIPLLQLVGTKDFGLTPIVKKNLKVS